MSAGVPGSFAAANGGLVAFAREKGVIIRGFKSPKGEFCVPLTDSSDASLPQTKVTQRKDDSGHPMELKPWAYGDGGGYEAGWNCDICGRSNSDMEGNEVPGGVLFNRCGAGS